ncbi:uncharacterized protein LOC144619258 [Crassostrea virginica]
MSLPEETCILDDLTDFESRLLAKRIPFMKITALPRGRQRGILGSVINVPSDVDETCEALPRTPTSAVDDSMASFQNNVQDSENLDHSDIEILDQHVEQPLDTCIQRSDLALDVSKAINFSPAEGKIPVGFMMDHGCEEMAFPKLFPTGKFGFDALRETVLTPKKYFNARILNKTGKFARNTEYLFFAQYITEYKQVMDNISIAIRKTYSRTESGQSINSSMIQNPDTLTSLISKDHAYQFLQTVRGSPPYWQKALYKLLAAVKQFGIFNFFVTLSSADLNWYDTLQAISRQQGKYLTEKEIDGMSFEEKSELLRSNPVTAARHFEHRLQSFFKSFLLSCAEPLGKIKHYSYRIEFQKRGSPHAHIVLWTEDAPSQSDDDEVICNYIDKYVTCKIPVENDDPYLYKLVTTVQQHHHTATSKKKGTFCRFNYPKLPSKKTLLAKKLDIQDPQQRQLIQHMNMDILTHAHSLLQNKDSLIESVEDLVQQLGLSVEDYMNAVRMSTRGSTVVLERTPAEIHTNYYNGPLLKTWGANIDVQYALDPYACITYMVAYITKDEREMSQILQAVSKECSSIGWKDKMKNCAKSFLNAREISAQEAVYRLLSFPLFKCSFRTVFVPADLPKNRVSFLKPLSVIKAMDHDEEDIYEKSIIDKYSLRPLSLENICLAQFAVWYVPVYNSTKEGGTETNADSEARVHNIIELRDQSGLMKKSGSPAVLRYHKKSVQKFPEEYYYSQLLLYIPWLNEETLLNVPSYEEQFILHKECIDKNRSELEHHTEVIEAAVQDFEANGPPLHAFDQMSSTVDQERSELLMEDVQLDIDSAVLHPLPEHEENNNSRIDHVPGSSTISYSIEMRPGVLPDKDFHDLVLTLNEKQRDVFQHLLKWCSDISISRKTGKTPEQICLFVSGGAGTGKSHLISALYQMAIRTLHVQGDNPDDIRISLVAPTGTAAHNISGTTIHSAFLLPLGQTKSILRLSDDKRNGLRSKAGKLDLLIIDEISMVSSDLLYQIHNRLTEIKGVSKPFGGVSVIAFGDLYQLPPVLQPFVFKPVNDVFANMQGSLWKNFSYRELDEVMRQKEDLHFATLLNRIRTATHTEEDVAFLRSREISVCSNDYPKEALHIFATNKAVDEHNTNMLNALLSQKMTLVAVDRKPSALSSYDVNSDPRFTGGLPSVISLGVGAKVMLIRNIDVSDGLVNGAQGTVIGFSRSGPEISVVLIQFNDPIVGTVTRKNSRYVTEDPTFHKSDMVVLTETWLSNDIPSDSLFPSQYYIVQRVDGDPSTSQSRRASGVLVSVKKPYTCTVLERHAGRYFQIIMVKIHGVLTRDIYIVSVYNSPHYLNSPHLLLEQITSMLSIISPTDPCLVVGDFNEDTLKEKGPITTVLKSGSRHFLCFFSDELFSRNINDLYSLVNPYNK